MLRLSDDLIREQSYLVARGVRPLALLGQCPADSDTMLATASRIEVLCDPGVIPFVINRDGRVADYGYAGAAWAVDLYRWTTTASAVALPACQRARILGLLLGYDRDAIRTFEESGTGRSFASPRQRVGRTSAQLTA